MSDDAPREEPSSGISPEQIRSARDGAPEALGKLLDLCKPYLLDIANDELPADIKGKVGASDVVQQTFLDASQGFGDFVGGTEPELKAWLRRMLVRNLTDQARLFGADMRSVDREEPLDSGRVADLEAPDASPSGDARAQEEANRLLAAIARLPEEMRLAVRLRQQDRLTFEEIGARLGRSADNVRKLWARAILRLRNELRTPDESDQSDEPG